jgi:hypothetical protein
LTSWPAPKSDTTNTTMGDAVKRPLLLHFGSVRKRKPEQDDKQRHNPAGLNRPVFS